MSVAAHEHGPASTGGGTGPVDVVTPGVRPRAGRVCSAPRLARRIDRRPAPRLRALHPVRAAPRTPEAREPAPVRDLTTPAWAAALDAARSQVGPVALRVLSAVAEVLDGVRPVEHLAAVCPAEIVERVAERIPAGRRTRGTRVRGLRMCPLVTAGADPVPAVEVAAALCGPTRARAVAARFELRDGGWRPTELVVG